MLIRKATLKDIPEIITVLRASLGEVELPLTEEIWNYKHILNPFGESIVLVAEEENKIAGVRAFMKWKWQKGTKVFSAYRAVDTATHPNFQGKGIFKKLTLKAVELGIEEKSHFVFNTPNEKSRPGYLKMGWKAIGKLKVGIKFSLKSFYKITSKEPIYSTEISATPDQIQTLCNSWNFELKETEKNFTPKSLEYLKWRYENNPLQAYQIFATSDLYLAGYVKKRRYIKELRISECIFIDNNESHRKLEEMINMWSSKFGVQIVSYSPDLFKPKKFFFKGNFGPIFTIRNLNLDSDDLISQEGIDNWRYSLGDLELF